MQLNGSKDSKGRNIKSLSMNSLIFYIVDLEKSIQTLLKTY